MKVLMVSYGDAFSGNAMRIIDLAKNISKNAEVTVLFSAGKHLEEQKFSVFYAPCVDTETLQIKFITSTITKSIKSVASDCDVVHCFKTLPTSLIPSYLTKKIRKVPLILDWDDLEGKNGFAEQDSMLIRNVINRFENWIPVKSDFITTVSDFIKNKAIRLGVHAHKIKIIPNGCDLERFNPKVVDQDGLEECLRLDGKSVVMYIGLLYKSTDLDFVICSFKHVIKSKDDVVLVVVGDGPKRKRFEKMCKSLDMDNHVKFTGMIDPEHIPKYLSIADVVCLPMKDNPANQARFPVKMGEYMAMGKAIVTNHVGVIPRYIKNEVNGIVTENDELKYGHGILKLLEDGSSRRTIGNNARKTAEDYLDWKKISNELFDVYREISNAA